MHTLFNFRVFVWFQLDFCFPLSLFLLLYKVTAQLMTLLSGGGHMGGRFSGDSDHSLPIRPPPPPPSAPPHPIIRPFFLPSPFFSFGAIKLTLWMICWKITGTRTNDYYQTKSRVHKWYLPIQTHFQISNICTSNKNRKVYAFWANFIFSMMEFVSTDTIRDKYEACMPP